MKITFDLALFGNRPVRVGRDDEGMDRVGSEKALLWLLESLANIDRIQIRSQHLPPLYKAGVVYRPEENTEVWKDAINIYKDGFGDCEDLASWRIAELRNNGKKASPYIRYRMERGKYLYHVLVMRAHDELEDPSRILGMGSE